jgi:hypothetical protein
MAWFPVEKIFLKFLKKIICFKKYFYIFVAYLN